MGMQQRFHPAAQFRIVDAFTLQEGGAFGGRGDPGRVLAYRDGAICIGTVDGAVWISHLKAKDVREERKGDGREYYEAGGPSITGIKLPATQVLGPLLHDLPEAPLPMDARQERRTFREITYNEEDAVGYLTFDFYNGAMSTSECVRLRDAFPRRSVAPNPGHPAARW